jgi:hypothetical protein
VKPLAIDLFCGLGGWTEGLLAGGYAVVGVDIEQPRYGDHAYPGVMVLHDVRTLHGSWFKDATLIVASPPCQKYSYMAMPWLRAKAKAAEIRADASGKLLEELNELFNACFRIQREASEAAGRYIPLIVENVRGAQPWVGKAAGNFGSFYLWGDVPMLPKAAKAVKVGTGSWRHPDDPRHIAGLGFNTHADRNLREGQKQMGLHTTYTHLKNGIKQGGDWFNASQPSMSRLYSSKSPRRKRASAMIAKIPEPLSRHIAMSFRP